MRNLLRPAGLAISLLGIMAAPMTVGVRAESAQSPFLNIIPGQCSPQYQKLLKLQIDAMMRLQGLARTDGAKLCAMLEGADQLSVDKLIDPKALGSLLSPQQREFLEALGVDVSKIDVARLMRLLGLDPSKIDLRQIKGQCRQSQAAIDSFASGELNRLERESLRCDDRV